MPTSLRQKIAELVQRGADPSAPDMWPLDGVDPELTSDSDLPGDAPDDPPPASSTRRAEALPT